MSTLTLTAADSLLSPPVAKMVPKSMTVLGDTRVDNYFWLRDRKDPDTTKYLEAENGYTETVMKGTSALQSKLYAEMLGRIKQTDLSVPTRRDGYFYYTRTEEGKQYAIHCRKKGTLDAPEEILMDENAMAAGKKYFRIGNFSVSPNHRLLAYSVDYDGDEEYTIHVKDLTTGKLQADQIPNTYYSLEWGNDNATFFYTVLDAAKRPYKVFRHTLGRKTDALVYHEPDERFTVELAKTSSRAYILINIGSALTSEVRYVSADRPKGKFQVVLPRVQETEYDITHHEDSFFIRTNDGGQDVSSGRSAGEGSVESELERGDRQARRCDHRECHGVQGSSGGGGAGSRLDEDPDSRISQRRHAFHRRSREPVYTASLGANAEYDTQDGAFRIHVAGDAQFGVRLQHGNARARAEEAAGGAGRVRSCRSTNRNGCTRRLRTG